MPISAVVADVVGDVAVPLDNALVPTNVPPVSQSSPLFAATSVGVHKKNSTVPVGVPNDPVTVTVSNVSVSGLNPIPALSPDGLDVVVIITSFWVVSKHSDTVLV